ncbi:MAG TPA: glutathione peroxidase [Planctomycetota bacterium]|nr:glutathione peroxidase [Planctomycetota bacterium]
MNEIWTIPVKTIKGEQKDLSEHKGNVLLIVNTASQCGFTPQYQGLEELWKKHKDKGLRVLGFPCNQFGKQEPGNEGEIVEFCSRNYGVSFPMHAKVDVNGPNAHPLFAHLKEAAPGIFGTEGIKWNFTKFLVDRQGKVVARYAPSTKPESIEKDVVEQLSKPA